MPGPRLIKEDDLTPIKRRALGTAMRTVLQVNGVAVCRSSWGKKVHAEGVYEFRLRMTGKAVVNLEAEIHGISEAEARERFGSWHHPPRPPRVHPRRAEGHQNRARPQRHRDRAAGRRPRRLARAQRVVGARGSGVPEPRPADRPADAARQGGFLHLGNWRNRAFIPATRRAGLAGVIPYNGRDTFASLLIYEGHPPILVARRPRPRGHPDPLAPLRRGLRGGRARHPHAHR